MGNRISSKVIKINDMTISNSKIFEKELSIILSSSEVYIINKEFFEQLEKRIVLEIQNRSSINYKTNISQFFTKLGYNMLNAKLSTVFINTVKGALLGYGGLYTYDKLRYPITSIKINENDNTYKVGYNDCLKRTLELTKKEHLKSIASTKISITKEEKDILTKWCIEDTNDIHKELTKDYTNPLLRMTLEGLGCGLVTNIFYNIVNCGSIYNENLLEIEKCLKIVQDHKDKKK